MNKNKFDHIRKLLDNILITIDTAKNNIQYDSDAAIFYVKLTKLYFTTHDIITYFEKYHKEQKP